MTKPEALLDAILNGEQVMVVKCDQTECTQEEINVLENVSRIIGRSTARNKFTEKLRVVLGL